jgi:hypothetical protein
MSRAVRRFIRVSPSLPAVGTAQGVVVYKIWGTLQQQVTINTFMFLGPNNSPTSTQLQTLLLAISTSYATPYLACLSSAYAIQKETLDVLHRNDIQGVARITNAGVAGARGATAEPTTVAGVVLRYSAVKGQHGRGRFSLPGIATADVTASAITASALLTAMNTLAVLQFANYSDGVNNWTGCIGQRATTAPKLVIGASAVNRITVTPLLGTIRRRKIGRGI